MKLELRGRNVSITDALRETCERRFARISKQVAEPAEVDIELSEGRNPANPDDQIATANLRMQGLTLHAEHASPDMTHSINMISEELARQLRRHRDKRRRRREARRLKAGAVVPEIPADAGSIPASSD